MVGKGLTFDSGGYTLKPGSAMTGMKFDMSGAAAVLEASDAIAQLDLPLRFVTVVGSTENMIDSDAFRVDDVVTAANGKTIEITNTDAEGRLVLADCLHHARSLGATHVVDLATLTGGVLVALGDYHAGLMGATSRGSTGSPRPASGPASTPGSCRCIRPSSGCTGRTSPTSRTPRTSGWPSPATRASS